MDKRRQKSRVKKFRAKQREIKAERKDYRVYHCQFQFREDQYILTGKFRSISSATSAFLSQAKKIGITNKRTIRLKHGFFIVGNVIIPLQTDQVDSVEVTCHPHTQQTTRIDPKEAQDKVLREFVIRTMNFFASKR